MGLTGFKASYADWKTKNTQALRDEANKNPNEPTAANWLKNNPEVSIPEEKNDVDTTITDAAGNESSIEPTDSYTSDPDGWGAGNDMSASNYNDGSSGDPYGDYLAGQIGGGGGWDTPEAMKQMQESGVKQFGKQGGLGNIWSHLLGESRGQYYKRQYGKVEQRQQQADFKTKQLADEKAKMLANQPERPNVPVESEDDFDMGPDTPIQQAADNLKMDKIKTPKGFMQRLLPGGETGYKGSGLEEFSNMDSPPEINKLDYSQEYEAYQKTQNPTNQITGITDENANMEQYNIPGQAHNVGKNILNKAMENQKKNTNQNITLNQQDVDPNLLADQEDQIYRKSLVSKNGYLVDPNTGEIVEEDDGSNLPLEGSNRQQATKDFQKAENTTGYDPNAWKNPNQLDKFNNQVDANEPSPYKADTTSWKDSHDPKIQAEADAENKRLNEGSTDAYDYSDYSGESVAPDEEQPNFQNRKLAEELSQGKITQEQYQDLRQKQVKQGTPITQAYLKSSDTVKQLQGLAKDFDTSSVKSWKDIPNEMIDAIFQQESGGSKNPNSLVVREHTRGEGDFASGAGQQREIFRNDVARIDPSMKGYDPHDPVQARKAAKIYMAHQIKNGFSVEQAFAAYNAGRSGARKGYGDKYSAKVMPIWQKAWQNRERVV